MPLLPGLPETASLLDLFRAYPDTARPLLAFHEVLLRGPSSFSEAERELIAAYVSGLNGCRYCHGVHTATAERLGVAQGAVAAALQDLESAPVDARMKPVLAFAGKLTTSVRGVTESDAQAILEAGWDTTALYHTVAVTALFNLMNRLVEGSGIALDPAYVKPAAERLADRGYSALLGMLGS
jgi:uncharacterized peroxidase-related enzyme